MKHHHTVYPDRLDSRLSLSPAEPSNLTLIRMPDWLMALAEEEAACERKGHTLDDFADLVTATFDLGVRL